jgi:PKD repeat protein
MRFAREFLAIGVVNDKIYAIGGDDNKNDEYDPALDTWTSKTPMPTPRCCLAVGVSYNKIYAIGGASHAQPIQVNEEYDPNGTVPILPTAPQNLQASAGDTQVTLTWSAPVSDGGSPITNYNIYSSTVSGTTYLHANAGNKLAYTDTGLINGMTYYYQVNAVNSAGEGPKSTEINVTLPNKSPIANFTYLPSSPIVNEMVQFTDLSSDPDGVVVSWTWDFGDGTHSTDRNSTHIFTAKGDYSVKLTVTDNMGAKTTVAKTVSVKESLDVVFFNTFIILIVAVVSLLIVVGLLVMLLLQKRRRNAKPTGPKSSQSDTPSSKRPAEKHP